MKMFIVLFALCMSACASRSQPQIVCSHPFVNGGMPTALPENANAYRDGSIRFEDQGKTIILRGAMCITVISQEGK